MLQAAPLFPLLLIPLILVGIWFVWQQVKKRRAAFQAWADAHGWSYDFNKRRDILHRFGFLDRMQHGRSRIGYDLLEGEWEGYPAAAFNFRYTTGSGKNQTTHHFGLTLIHLERSFPELRISPENILSRFGQFLGYDDIDFESVEFSRAFTVRSPDKKFAYDFCHTGMMEFLCRHSSTALELEGDVLALFTDRVLSAERLDPMLSHLIRIRENMPEYLFRN